MITGKHVWMVLAGAGLAAVWGFGWAGTAHGGQDAANNAAATAGPAAHEDLEYNLYLPPAHPKPEMVVEKLDELGHAGWRLVTTTTANGGTSGFIFVRPRRPGN